MNYCPECGAELGWKLDGGRERPACPACSYIFFGQFSIGVGGVVVRDGKVLLIQRGPGPGKGGWQIPGGYAEQDEAIDVAVVREVYEETGVRARPRDVIGLRHLRAPTGTNVYVVFRLEAEDGEPHGDGEETAAARYFTLEEIADMERLSKMSRWAIQTALTTGEGFGRVEGVETTWPGWVLYGLSGRT